MTPPAPTAATPSRAARSPRCCPVAAQAVARLRRGARPRSAARRRRRLVPRRRRRAPQRRQSGEQRPHRNDRAADRGKISRALNKSLDTHTCAAYLVTIETVIAREPDGDTETDSGRRDDMFERGQIVTDGKAVGRALYCTHMNWCVGGVRGIYSGWVVDWYVCARALTASADFNPRGAMAQRWAPEVELRPAD